MQNYPSGIQVLKNMELIMRSETIEHNWQVAFNPQTFTINPLAYRMPLWEKLLNLEKWPRIISGNQHW